MIGLTDVSKAHSAPVGDPGSVTIPLPLPGKGDSKVGAPISRARLRLEPRSLLANCPLSFASSAGLRDACSSC